MERIFIGKTLLIAVGLDFFSATRALATDEAPVPEKFEAGVVAGYKESRLLGLYLLSPVFFLNLRGGIEASSTSYDFYTDDGKIEERDSAEFSLSLLSRAHITKSFYWSTKIALGAATVRGRRVSEDSSVSKKTTLPFSEFESSFGSWATSENYQAGDWAPNAEAGVSFRHNVRKEEVFLIGGQEPLAAGSVGAFVRVGIGI